MPGIYERYRNVDYALPASYLSWDLFGAGLEHLGRDGKAVELPLRDPNADELLLRVDALGLCFSDAKLIWAGNEHPRIRGRDLQNNPTVAGHEAALTVARVGANWKNKYQVGQRFIIQADIVIGGEQKAFGYVQRGAMAQYAYVGPWVLDGDGVCYLLPMQEKTGYAEAALVEPWACVEGAYRIAERAAPAKSARALAVFVGGAKADFAGLFPGGEPARFDVLGDTAAARLPDTAAKKGPATPEAVKAAAAEAGGYTDIYLIGVPDAALTEACDAALAKSGFLCFIGDQEIPGRAAMDIGRAHYELTRHVGTADGKPANAYGRNSRTDLLAGGKTWMVGAAGPMGQMHVQRALELPNPPKTLFCTDLSDERLNYMVNRLRPLAEKKGVQFVAVNVGKVNLAEKVRELTGGAGFDDVYVHAPVAKLVEEAADYLAEQSILNVFAGVGIGTMAKLPPEMFRKLHSRLIGSSGSGMDDIIKTLNKMEAGQLATRMSLAALGGIEATWNGVKGLKENRFPGKTVIFPQLRGVPLTGLDSFAGVCPAAAAALENGSMWTNAAETIFLEQNLKLDA